MIERRADDIIITPATCMTYGWRVMLLCSRGCPARRLPMDWRMKSHWDEQWWSIFAGTKFVCRCGALADGLRIERETRHDLEELLFVGR